MAGFLLAPASLLAFPEMIRTGYQTCRSCHYASSGGGQINQYGRAIAGERLSTWGTPESAEVAFGAFNFAPLDPMLTGRYLYDSYKDDQISIRQRFWMQREVSLAYNPSKNVTFLATGGLYGPDPKKTEFRTYYANITAGPFWIRAGRFLPAFNMQIENHRYGIQEFLGQGDETVNFEGGYSNKYFEASLTRVWGASPEFRLTDEPTFTQKNQWDGYTATVKAFVHEGVQLQYGHVFANIDDKKADYSSFSLFAGLQRVYFQGEYQVHPEGVYKEYAMIGVEPIKGLHLRAEYDGDETKKDVWGTIKFYPYPHFDLTLSGSKKEQTVVTHFWL